MREIVYFGLLVAAMYVLVPEAVAVYNTLDAVLVAPVQDALDLVRR